MILGVLRWTLVPVLALAPATAAQAQRLGGAATPDVSLVRVFLALLVCLIAAVLAVLLLRQRYGRGLPPMFSRLGPRSARINLIESRRIAPQSELCLLRCDSDEYLLLISGGNLTVLRQGPAVYEPGEQV